MLLALFRLGGKARRGAGGRQVAALGKKDDAMPPSAGVETKEIPGTRVVSSHEKPVAHLPKFGYCSCPSP